MFARIVATIVVAVTLAASSYDASANPSYILLQPAYTAPGHGAHTSNTPGRRYGVSSNGYNYGWFGVAPRRHKVRSYGYYGNHRQWTFR